MKTAIFFSVFVIVGLSLRAYGDVTSSLQSYKLPIPLSVKIDSDFDATTDGMSYLSSIYGTVPWVGFIEPIPCSSIQGLDEAERVAVESVVSIAASHKSTYGELAEFAPNWEVSYSSALREHISTYGQESVGFSVLGYFCIGKYRVYKYAPENNIDLCLYTVIKKINNTKWILSARYDFENTSDEVINFRNALEQDALVDQVQTTQSVTMNRDSPECESRSYYTFSGVRVESNGCIVRNGGEAVSPSDGRLVEPNSISPIVEFVRETLLMLHSINVDEFTLEDPAYNGFLERLTGPLRSTFEYDQSEIAKAALRIELFRERYLRVEILYVIHAEQVYFVFFTNHIAFGEDGERLDVSLVGDVPINLFVVLKSGTGFRMERIPNLYPNTMKIDQPAHLFLTAEFSENLRTLID